MLKTLGPSSIIYREGAGGGGEQYDCSKHLFSTEITKKNQKNSASINFHLCASMKMHK